MKTILKATTFLLLSIITSCNSDDSTLNCDFGYEKDANDKCSIPWAQKFVRTNLASKDECTGKDNGTFIYNTTITLKNATTLSTSNLFGFTASNIIELNVISPTEVSFNYTDIAGRIFTGTGTKIGNELTLNFKVNFPTAGVLDNVCTTVITYPN